MKITNEEAIEAIKSNYPSKGTYTILAEALDMAMSALEKQIPKEPIEKESGWYYCPTCNTQVPAYAKSCCGSYPGKQGCGQRVEWEELK